MDEDRQIIHNSIMCPDGTILVSESRHDYQEYQDENGKVYMVDGGHSYLRRSCNGDELDLSQYSDAPHVIQRAVIKWGTYGKKGDENLHYIPIRDMSTGHLEAVVALSMVRGYIAACMKQELRDRKQVEEGKYE